MKAVSNKSDLKKRKRDDSQEPISESPKRTKVHAQRKFAQGVGLSSPAITPIKDKSRPSASVTTPGPMLTSKRPNTEDFLTFLCFRRTSILPPKLDFFKEALRPETQTPQNNAKSLPAGSVSGTQKSGVSDQSAKQKKTEKNDENKKSEIKAVQALRQKYQKKRLANQKPTNVTKLAQKVKGKNMIRTRSSGIVEEIKTTNKKENAGKEKEVGKENKSHLSGLRSGLQRKIMKPAPNNKKTVVKKTLKNTNLRSGLRSGGFVKSEKGNSESKPVTPSNVKKADGGKKPKPEIAEQKPKAVKGPVKKVEGFSDFSSDDNEPLLAVKKLKSAGKNPPKKSVESKDNKKTSVKTRSQNNEPETNQQASIRPTRKTKEAAAVYMEMITKKLVSPEKSGEDDLSSVDSFPELPNVKRNEQRESEIKAKALATRKSSVPEPKQKAIVDDKAKENKKAPKKPEEDKKIENKKGKEIGLKKGSKGNANSSANAKKETKNDSKQEKKGNPIAKKEEFTKTNSGEAKEKSSVKVNRPSTRSRSQEDVLLKEKKVNEALLKKSKALIKKSLQKRAGVKAINQPRPAKKPKLSEKDTKDEQSKNTSSVKNPTIGKKDSQKEAEKKEIQKEVEKKGRGKKKNVEKKETKEKSENSKNENKKPETKEAEKSNEGKSAKKDETNNATSKKSNKTVKTEEKAADPPEKKNEPSMSNKRPTRKCSTVDKIWIDIDGFTSDEEDFIDVRSITSARSSTKKSEDNTKSEAKKKLTKKTGSKAKDNKKAPEKTENKERKSKNKSEAENANEKEKTKGESTVKKGAVKNEVESNSNKEATKSNPAKSAKSDKSDVKSESDSNAKEMTGKTGSSKEKKIAESEAPDVKSENKKEPAEKAPEPKVSQSENRTGKTETSQSDKKPETSKTSGKEKSNDKTANVEPGKVPEKLKEEPIRKLEKLTESKPEINKTKKEDQNKKTAKSDKEIQITKKEVDRSVNQTEKSDAKKESKGNIETKKTDSEKKTGEAKKELKKRPNISSKTTRESSKGKTETSKRNLRERTSVRRLDFDFDADDFNDASVRRTRPVRQCSTGEKMWIESDSDSFSYFASSDDEDNLPISDFNIKNKEKPVSEKPEEKKKESNVETEKSEPKKESPVKESGLDASCCDNFSESDEEPLKKKTPKETKTATEEKKPEQPKTENVEKPAEVKSPVPKTIREMPELHPLKKTPSETIPKTPEKIWIPPPKETRPQMDKLRSPLLEEPKPAAVVNKPEIQLFRHVPNVPMQRPETSRVTEFKPTGEKMGMGNLSMGPIVSVPNRIEAILQTLKSDKRMEVATTSNLNVPSVPVIPDPMRIIFQTSQSVPMSSRNQFVYTLPSKSMNLPRPREPINTHGLDLLSEVALPTPKDKMNSQTERIEKWLKESAAVDNKKPYSAYEDVEYKCDVNKMVSEQQVHYQPDKSSGYTKPISGIPKVASHQELRKFEQIELIESQKLIKKPVLKPEPKAEISKPDQPVAPKKVVTSVQDLLKLQKERKELPKPSVDNSPHSKNCKCNSCVVKKGWFKNKPVPKSEEPKMLPHDEAEETPFESLSKAFTKISSDQKSPKMSVSVAPLMHSTPSTSSCGVSTMAKIGSPEKKTIFQQRKMSFLERMKEREKKEAALMKSNPNAFSPNNESSVYAFEPEPEQSASISTPFRSKTRDSRTSSTNTSKSEEDVLKICEDETSQISSGTQADKKQADKSTKVSQSASIAVQVNLDTESVAQMEATPEPLDGKSIEISTQTEVPEEDSDSPMFYIPLQQSSNAGTSASDQQLIQGVALKLGTEGPMGPNQRVIMKAKLVTKPPDNKAVVMPQPKRLFDQKNNNPPVGTVQPTARKPPEILSDESSTNKSLDSDSLPPPTKKSAVKNDSNAELVSQASTDSGVGSEVFSSRNNRASPSTSSKSSKTREKSIQSGSKDRFEFFEEGSPGSSTSAKSKRITKQKSSESVINPTNSTWLPPAGSPSKLVEAPTFHPTEKEFQDPLEFLERIRPAAEKFGLCRIVPPSNFKPDCKVTDDMRFTAYNQYVHRMLHRWGPNVKEMMAIKKYLATQSISLKQPPWIGGIEVDLPRLYQSVQNCGGLMKVMEKKKWHQVADMMKIPKAAQDRVTKLDDIYCKYLLPYDTLSHDERQKLFDEVEKDWLDRQKSSESQDSQNDEESEDENYIEECEECIAKGRNMALNQFYRIARNTMSMWFKNPEPSASEVENEFWKHVNERNHHVCVHSGSIDSSGWGYGFPIAKNNAFAKHPWNLKVLTNNSGSVLRSLGPVMGVTVPTIHVGMVFTAFCWYRDPHGLPWIEYLHTGAPKIWYGISDDNSTVFQDAMTKLLPRYIKNKTIWLPSDTAMVPPNLLVEQGVSLCRTVQEPGQFILVFPRAFISSICTGYLVSESVYFAQSSWLTTAEQVFKDIQESCEPSMFSLEKLLFNIATDSRSSVDVLKQVLPMVWHIKQNEMDGRKTLFNLGLKTSERLPMRGLGNKKKKGRWTQEEDGDYECEICRANLYVSLVTNSHEEGVYCLPHAIELLTQKRHHLKYCKLLYSYSQEEMNELVEKLEQRIESKSQKKLQGKSSTATK